MSSILQILYNNQAIELEDALKVEILGNTNSSEEAVRFIRNLDDLVVNESRLHIVSTSKQMPTIKDIDGLFLVSLDNDDNTIKYKIYKKETVEIKGYIYNSVDVQINCIGLLEVLDNKTSADNIIQKNTTYQVKHQKAKKLKNKKTIKQKPNQQLNRELIKELKDKLKKLQEKKTN